MGRYFRNPVERNLDGKIDGKKGRKEQEDRGKYRVENMVFSSATSVLLLLCSQQRFLSEVSGI